MSTIWGDIKSTIENASTNPISVGSPLAGLALSIDSKGASAAAPIAGKVVKGAAKGILSEIIHYAPNLIMIIAGLVLVFYAIKSSGAVDGLTSVNITEVMGGGKKETAKVPVEKAAKEGAKKTAKETAKKTATAAAETAAEVAVA